jgi:diacylglycerol kinase (ATP)
MWYGVMGGHAVLHRNFETFASDVKLYANGKRIELPADTEGLIFLNISSYAGGAR